MILEVLEGQTKGGYFSYSIFDPSVNQCTEELSSVTKALQTLGGSGGRQVVRSLPMFLLESLLKSLIFFLKGHRRCRCVKAVYCKYAVYSVD